MTILDDITDHPVVLDGGLATQLEAQGSDVSSRLWSARLLRDDPDAIRTAHHAFFAAGSSVATTASYQATFDGFAAFGIEHDEARSLMIRSIDLARSAASEFSDRPTYVAASVGPYGAMLADGSEYRGDYGLTVEQLRAFHRPRLEALASAAPDILALETIPCAAEAEALLLEIPSLGIPVWLALTVSGQHTRNGESLTDVFAMATDVASVAAVGINCSTPRDATLAVALAAKVTGKPVVVYPNSGEGWDSTARAWTGHGALHPEQVKQWVADGAKLVGGCCRVGPSAISRIAESVGQVQASPGRSH